MRRFLLCLLLTGCVKSQPLSVPGFSTLNVADAALESGNPTLALQISRANLFSNPADKDAMIYEAKALYNLDRVGEAQKIYEKLYSAQSKNLDVTVGLAKCLVQDNVGKAVSLFKLAVAASPYDSGLLTNLGVAEDLSGDHKSARVAYKRALNIDPMKVSTQADIALSLVLSGDANEAIKILKPLAESQDSDERVRQDYGAVLSIGGHVNRGSTVLAVDLPIDQAYKAALSYQSLGYSALKIGK